MNPNPSIRSTLKMKYTEHIVRNIVAKGKPVWSDIVHVVRKTRDGNKEQLQWRVEVCPVSAVLGSYTMRVRLHWIKGQTTTLYWRHQGHRHVTLSTQEHATMIAGQVVEHGVTFSRFKSIRLNNSGPLNKDGMEIGNFFEAQLDIFADVDQNNEDLNGSDSSSSINRDLGHMLKAGKMADVNLVCKERKFPCHRLILASRSKVFEAMFEHKNFKENQDDCIMINDFEQEDVEQLLQFAYCDKCDFGKIDPWALLALADKYDMQSFANYCSKVSSV